MKREDKSVNEILDDIVKLSNNPEDLRHWTNAIETTAKHMCKDTKNRIMFKLTADRKLRYFLFDIKSRDCLVKSIEIHLPSMPEMLQGLFSVLKYELKNVTFDKIEYL